MTRALNALGQLGLLPFLREAAARRLAQCSRDSRVSWGDWVFFQFVEEGQLGPSPRMGRSENASPREAASSRRLAGLLKREQRKGAASVVALEAFGWRRVIRP